MYESIVRYYRSIIGQCLRFDSLRTVIRQLDDDDAMNTFVRIDSANGSRNVPVLLAGEITVVSEIKVVSGLK